MVESWFRYLTLFGAVGLLAAGCGKTSPPAPPGPPPPTPVFAARPAPDPEGGAQTYTGTVRARYEADLGFRVGGKLVGRKVEVGDRVAPGQVLGELDPADLELALRSAENERNSASAAALRAGQDEGRQRSLLGSGAIAQAEYDSAKASLDSAAESLKRSERALDTARNRLGYATLKADEAGVVTAIPVEVGQVLTEGQPAFRVARLAEREAVVGIPESRLAGLKGAAATVRLFGGGEYPASLREISPSADPATRTFQARFRLPDGGKMADLGMTAAVSLAPRREKRPLTVPLAAVLRKGDSAAVWVIDPPTGKLALTPVTVAEYRSDRAVLSGGLSGAELVVRAGVQKLDANLTVRILEDEK